MTGAEQLVMFDTARGDGIIRGALLSRDEVYRYALTRAWAEPGRVRSSVLWVMLNPSTADALVDDPTIRRCIAFSRRWGYDALAVVNLYAWRATSPAELNNPRGQDVAIGPDNDRHIAEAAARCDSVVAAWGSSLPSGGELRAADVLALLRLRHPVCHLGFTKAGHPRHPLYLRADLTPSHWAAV